MNHQATHANERGQAIVILAFAMIVLLAFAALAIDGGNAYVNRRRAQNASDAGALAGARQLWLNRSVGNPDNISVAAAVNKAAEENGMADSDAMAGNYINTNIKAYYTDSNGNPTPSGVSTPLEVWQNIVPSWAKGVQVTSSRDYSTFIEGIVSRGNQSKMGATALATAVVILPLGCGDYAVYGAGPSQNNTVHMSGSDINIVDGGIYGGPGGSRLNNVEVTSNPPNPPPSVNIVAPCHGCDVGGNAATNYNADGEDMPALYGDDGASYFAPDGQYATAAGSAYHYYSGNFRPSNNAGLNGLYYVEGDVDIHGASGTASIVAMGQIVLNGTVNLTTYDTKFPVLFSMSDNTAQGAIKISSPNVELHGFVYAPNGLVSFSSARGRLFGAIYGKQVKWTGSRINIVYEQAYCPPSRAKIVLLK